MKLKQKLEGDITPCELKTSNKRFICVFLYRNRPVVIVW